jgi:hypothetical protein
MNGGLRPVDAWERGGAKCVIADALTVIQMSVVPTASKCQPHVPRPTSNLRSATTGFFFVFSLSLPFLSRCQGDGIEH